MTPSRRCASGISLATGLAMGLVAVLGGCAGAAPLRLDPQMQDAPPAAVPTVQPLVLNTVPWRVYNRADLEALVAKLRAARDGTSVIFALDPAGLQNLKLNFIEIERYLGEQKAVIALLTRIVNQQSGVVETPAVAAASAFPGNPDPVPPTGAASTADRAHSIPNAISRTPLK